VPKFNTLAVKEIRQETADCVSISFDIPGILKQDYLYTQGQNVTLRAVVEGEDIRRSYSICSSPLENELRVAIKKVVGGKFSGYANTQLSVGDKLQVMTPTGKFSTPLLPDNAKNYLAIAAGSGITPILSILKTTLAFEPNSQFTLVYGNKNTASIIFREEIEGLKNKYLNRLRVYYVLSKEAMEVPLFYGRIDEQKCATLLHKLIGVHIDEAFLCGPEEMIFAAKKALIDKNVSEKNIHFELFTTTKSIKSVVQHSVLQEVGSDNQSPKSEITIWQDGLAYNFNVAIEGDFILDAAAEIGADLPYACKAGVCCTCKAKLLEGTVSMDVNYGLEPDEIERGFVLTCQARATSEKVVVSFDEK
jgi:ring-1,2-phenylacetyl-CoA epoxidase subunit PaaE